MVATPPGAESAPLTLTLVLRRTDEAGFRRHLREVSDPGSARFRRFPDQDDLSARFGPSQESYDAVLAWLAQQGFALVQGSANRLTITVTGTRGRAERAFALRIRDYRIGERSFYANDRDPAVPIELARHVAGVSGLANLAVAKTALKTTTPTDVFNRCRDDLLGLIPPVAAFQLGMNQGQSLAIDEQVQDVVSVLTFMSVFFSKIFAFISVPYAIGDCVGFYGGYLSNHPPRFSFSGLPHAGAPVNAQKIGLLEFDTFHPSDVRDWLTLIGADPTALDRLNEVRVNGGLNEPGPQESEVLLDIATAMIADPSPNTTFTVYSAPIHTSFEQLFNAMINDGVTVISNSWSQCEDQTSLAEAASIDSVLAQAAASGISVFNGSGDTGSTCLDGSPNTVGVPASSPHATAVGGTTPSFGRGLTYGGETWWNGSGEVPPTGQGGFGVSRHFARPVYQNGLTTATMRSVPDVAVAADPRAGVSICQASAGGCPTGSLYGGTSMAAPFMAGMVAYLNESLGTNIGEANPVLYSLANTPAFHSAASMGSDFAHVGLGSPSFYRLLGALSQYQAGPVDPSTSKAGGTILPVADGTTPAIVRVNLTDANVFPVSGKTVSLTPNPGSNAIVSVPSGPTDDYGAVTFAVTNTTPETVTFTVTADGVVLAAKPRLSFVAPPATVGGIIATPGTVAADGASVATIAVTLQDANGHGTPGKLVSLSQGPGHSLITGSVPALTDVNGQIQFTATNTVGETVTYTAVDVTDGNLPIPGSAHVTFTGGSASCLTPPTAASGFTITPFANGFLAKNFFFGNINFIGCPGASNPAFDTMGNVFVADFPDGNLYKFSSIGGVVTNADLLSNQAPTFGNLAIGKDGSLYGTHFSPGNIVQVDPGTGTVVRVVASGFPCPNGLAVDPLSGDLFFDDNCTGGGSDNPSVWRIHNPSSPNPSVTVYATLPATPGGGIAFAPNGTLYVVAKAFGSGPMPIVQIGGTNTGTATVTAVSGITSDDGSIAIGATFPGGAAKSLIVHTGGALKVIDIASPAVATTLATGTIGAGVIGPDGCLYANAHDTILKLAPSSGGCGFTPTNPAPALGLTPPTVSPNPAQGSSTSFTATLRNVGQPQGTPIAFTVGGANSVVKLIKADSAGQATFTYLGARTGTDTVIASAIVDGAAVASNPAQVSWGGGAHVTSLTLNLSPAAGASNTPVSVVASLVDVSTTPASVVAGAVITFSLRAQSCNGVTDASGNASCTLTPTGSGIATLTATFGGSAQYTAAVAFTGFRLLTALGPTAPDAPAITGALPGDGQLTILFTPPSNSGGSPITSYLVTCTPVGGGAATTATGAGSPITVAGLTNGVVYNCAVEAINAVGHSAPARISVADVQLPPGGCTPPGGASVASADRSEATARADVNGGIIPMVAAILPSSRSVQVGCPATAFATIINTGSVTATGVGIAPPAALPASLNFQTTNPLTNAVTGSLNTPVDIAPGHGQTYVIALTPAVPFDPTDLAFSYEGSNTASVSVLTGINTLLLSASATPVPDIVALGATLDNDGIVKIPGPTGTGVFAVATVNVGVASTITASADTGSGNPPVTVLLCQTNPSTGQCISDLGTTVTTPINGGATPTFGVFVTGAGVVAFDPAVFRIFVRFADTSGVTRGSTSVAVVTR